MGLAPLIKEKGIEALCPPITDDIRILVSRISKKIPRISRRTKIYFIFTWSKNAIKESFVLKSLPYAILIAISILIFYICNMCIILVKNKLLVWDITSNEISHLVINDYHATSTIQWLFRFFEELKRLHRNLDYFHRNNIPLNDNASILLQETFREFSFHLQVFCCVSQKTKVFFQLTRPIKKQHIALFLQRSLHQKSSFWWDSDKMLPVPHAHEKEAISSFPRQDDETADPIFHLYWEGCALFYIWSKLCYTSEKEIPDRVQEFCDKLDQLISMLEVQANRFERLQIRMKRRIESSPLPMTNANRLISML